MAKIEFDINKVLPHNVNPKDPINFRTDMALGSFGAIPPYISSALITEFSDSEVLAAKYKSIGLLRSVMPMKLKSTDDSEWFTLPIEPLVTISGRNTIVRRRVAKSTSKGTIKESWSQDDFDVTIQGLLIGQKESEYPQEYVKKIMTLFDNRESLEVDQPVLKALGIKFLAIESVSFPHTKGNNNQSFEIKAYSDNNANLLISE